MIQMITSENTLKEFLHYKLDDEGIEVEVDSTLNTNQYIGIKVDDYYNNLHMSNPPKSTDFVVAVDCSCDVFVLYVLEFKNVKSPSNLDIKAIHEKFKTTIDDFMKERYKHIFCNDRYSYRDVKLYLISDAYHIQGRFQTYEEYRGYMEKINKKDSLKVDISLGSKLYSFRGKTLTILFDIPPNPVIKKIF